MSKRNNRVLELVEVRWLQSLEQAEVFEIRLHGLYIFVIHSIRDGELRLGCNWQ